ncbi:uncharacterized protein rnf180a isoform X2 [Maylandia zebra]|uniref:uncharacterized protein rnf180a isoform X2 n=1 Tax=Maylandia zebra TaxID=106582 RepID=UPI00032A261E|nr:E3 ubiquitin-protein ligase RNF180 isoform X2 [Maylandia zebra]
MMSSHVGASSVNVSNRVGCSEAEDAGEETSTNETHTPKVERSRQRSVNPAGEGRSSNVLVRPALSGGKARKKTCSEDNKGSWREQNQDRGEETITAGDLEGRERGKSMERRMAERDETHGDEAQYRQRRESIGSLSSNNSDHQLNNILELGEGSSNLQRGHTCSRLQSTGCNWTFTSSSNALSRRPAAHTRSIPRSPQRPLSRPAAGDLHLYSLSSFREPDPFWVESSTGNPSSSSSEDDEALTTGDREGYICAVCLDVYFSPYMCHPCNHIFCEPCLRTLAKNSPTNTPCPLCRTIITHVFFQKELNQTARTFFPKEYLSRKQNFQKASCAKWPLPSCRKLFRIFGGFQRQSSPIARRQFPHGEGYPLDTMDFEDDTRGWRFDMDMVIIYIYSVNWVIGFFIFCFLCYFFFPSF